MSSQLKAVTYIRKKPTKCPICKGVFFREEMLSGRGRMIAGRLTDELRRLYETSKKFGEIYPLIYPVTVCPHCYYAAWKEDFAKIHIDKQLSIKANSNSRVAWVKSIIDGKLDFISRRTLKEGLASYILCLKCYDFQEAALSPIIKQGISALRAAWLATDLHRKDPDMNYDYLAKMLYRKAAFFYRTAVEYEKSGVQSIEGCANLGPDLDQNYMFDGVLYIYAYLELRHGPVKNPQLRETNLRMAKQIIAYIFGMGKASRGKPLAILEKTRHLHDEISRVLGLK